MKHLLDALYEKFLGDSALAQQLGGVAEPSAADFIAFAKKKLSKCRVIAAANDSDASCELQLTGELEGEFILSWDDKKRTMTTEEAMQSGEDREAVDSTRFGDGTMQPAPAVRIM